MRHPRILLSILLLCATLAIPSAAGAQSNSTYTVQRGDRLGDIAARFGTTAAAIVRANGLASPDRIYAGQRLVIPGRSTGTTPPATGGGARYTIRAGDTLGSIAARFGVSAAALARANNITNPNLLRVGATLIIPGIAGSTQPNPAPAPTPKPGNTTPAPTTGRRFAASISQQMCWLYNGNTVEATWRCSTGRRGAPTLPGSFKVRSKLGRAWGGTWGFWMPYWLGIYMAGSLENGIHGLPYSPSGRKDWQDKVGTPITFGCILLDDEAARTLFNVAYIGMPVIILR